MMLFRVHEALYIRDFPFVGHFSCSRNRYIEKILLGQLGLSEIAENLFPVQRRRFRIRFSLSL